MSDFNRAGNLWGIDLGGTKIEGVILRSEENPEVLLRHRVATEADQGYEHVLGQVSKLVDLMAEEAAYRPDRLGIGTPGTLVPATGLLKNSNALALNGQPMQQGLEERLGLKVMMANDANCFVLAETRLGVVKAKYPNARVVFGIIMGTGVGGGIVVKGQLINGFHGIGGEWGHNFLDEKAGYSCYCGKTGCNESILSGPSLQRFYQEQSGLAGSMKEIVVRARKGSDAAAVATMQRLTSYFGRALSSIVNVIDPDVIVVGGGLGNVDELYTQGVREVAPFVFNQTFEAPVLKPMLGDSAGVFGAAYLSLN